MIVYGIDLPDDAPLGGVGVYFSKETAYKDILQRIKAEYNFSKQEAERVARAFIDKNLKKLVEKTELKSEGCTKFDIEKCHECECYAKCATLDAVFEALPGDIILPGSAQENIALVPGECTHFGAEMCNTCDNHEKCQEVYDVFYSLSGE